MPMRDIVDNGQLAPDHDDEDNDLEAAVSAEVDLDDSPLLLKDYSFLQLMSLLQGSSQLNRGATSSQQSTVADVQPQSKISSHLTQNPWVGSSSVQSTDSSVIQNHESRVIDFAKLTHIPSATNRGGINIQPSNQQAGNIQRNRAADEIKYRPLIMAARVNGDWETTKQILEADPDALNARFTSMSFPILHVAVIGQQETIVEELVKFLPPEALELKDCKGETALHHAAKVGLINAAKAMVEKNPRLTQIRGDNDCVPLLAAAVVASDGQKEMVEYLCTVTKDEDHEGTPSPFSGPLGAFLIYATIVADFYDITLSLVQRFPKLVTTPIIDINSYALEVLAGRPFAFQSGSRLTSWQRFIYSFIPVDIADPQSSGVSSSTQSGGRPMTKLLSVFQTYLARVPAIEQLYKQKLMHEQALALVKFMCAQYEHTVSYSSCMKYFEDSDFLKEALKAGTVEVVEECLRTFPSLIWHSTKGQKLIEIAIEERNEKILSLICELSGERKKFMVSTIYERDNTILHLVAKLAPSRHLNLVSGATLQMQKEMQWFKGVENIIQEKDRLKRNSDGNTAQFIFTEEHKDLVEKAEKWMKETSQSCMVVATLIVTVAFAAAFTVPGGNISDTESSKNGIPIFLNKNSFMVFAISDALALFSSVTSVLMFLAILTSRYAEEDFLVSLPQKLILGLATLFISLATTMIAFGATLGIVLGNRLAWVPVPIALFACVPVTLFATLQFPLFVRMVRSTYWPIIFRKQSKPTIKPNDKKEK